MNMLNSNINDNLNAIKSVLHTITYTPDSNIQVLKRRKRITSLKKKCVYCGSKNLARVSRLQWMHWLPGCKCYTCRDCHCVFITLYGVVKIGIDYGYSRLKLFNKTNMNSM
jgi:hypothetical protein